MTKLNCASHGSREWMGHVICAECGQTYQTRDPHARRFASAACRCGRPLMPPAAAEPVPRPTTGPDVLFDVEVSKDDMAIIQAAAEREGRSVDEFCRASVVRALGVVKVGDFAMSPEDEDTLLGKTPIDGTPKPTAWTARAICDLCFRRIGRQYHGKMPISKLPPFN